MPKQKLVESSVLLTPHGWRKLGIGTGENIVLGADRTGRLACGNVRIRTLEATNSIVFVGTKSAFGLFHQDTCLIDADGTARTANQIVQGNEIGNLLFENICELDEFSLTVDDAYRIWTELEKVALLGDMEELVIFARGRWTSLNLDWAIDLGSVSSYHKTPGCQSYLSIQKDKFLKALVADPSHTLRTLILARFEVTVQGSVEIDRDEFYWCLWFLLVSNQITNYNYEPELKFDNLQHTTVVSIGPKTSKSSKALSKGATAFLRNQSSISLEIIWEDSSWSPICSGFILPAL